MIFRYIMRISEKKVENDQYRRFWKKKKFSDTLYGDVRKRQKMVGIGIFDRSVEFLGRNVG